MTKQCTKCGVFKSLDSFHKSKQGKYGRYSVCKDCRKIIAANDYINNKEKIDATNAAWYSRNSEKHCKNSKKRYRKNKKKRLRQNRAWQKANPERVKENSVIYRANNAEQIKIKESIYYANNRDIILKKQSIRYENDPGKKLKMNANWDKANPGKRRAYTRNYQIRKMQAMPKWLSKEQKREIESFYIKAKELEKGDGEKRSVDHIIPLKGKNVSGLHVPWNLQILTKKENSKKGNKLV
jgi:hypothetical protein